jgi:EmrB/QacA subfamily drug resistance transporter
MSHGHEVHSDAAADAAPDPRRWLALVFLCLAQFILIIDITVVQIALPSIGADLDLGREALTWVVTTYTLFFGGLMVLGGRLADELGARRLLLAGVVVFTAGSLVCGLSGDGAVLIAGRAAQGIGAAMVSPSALSIITTTFHGPELSRAMGVWAAIGGAGVALGLLLSGLLTAGPGWQWVFFINLPVGLLLLFAVPTIVRQDPARADRQRVDVPGAVLVTSATALLIYGLITAGDDGWGAAATLLPIAGAALLYGAFFTIERGMRAPLMRMQTLTRRPVVAGTLVMLTATALMLAMFFLGSLYLQQVRGYSALETGLVFLPVAIAVTAGAHLGSQLIGRLGARAVAAAAFLIGAAGLVLMAQLSADGSIWATLMPGFIIAVFGIGPAFVTATTTALGNVPHDEAGVASGVVNTFHELGGAIGVAVASTVAASSIAGGPSGVDGFSDAFIVCAIAAAAVSIAALVVVPGGRTVTAVAGHGHGH